LAGAFEPIFTMTGTRAACCSGVTRAVFGWCSGTPALGYGPGLGTQGGLARSQVNALRKEVLWSGRPSGRCDQVRVLVACGQGQPCVRRKSLARAHKETSTADAARAALACGAGREEMPSRHSSHMLCRTATRKGVSPIRTRGFDCRAAVYRRFGYERSGGSRPQRWGTATDEEQTFEGCSAGGNADLVRAFFGW